MRGAASRRAAFDSVCSCSVADADALSKNNLPRRYPAFVCVVVSSINIYCTAYRMSQSVRLSSTRIIHVICCSLSYCEIVPLYLTSFLAILGNYEMSFLVELELYSKPRRTEACVYLAVSIVTSVYNNTNGMWYSFDVQNHVTRKVLV